MVVETYPEPQPDPPDPVGVASAEHVGTQLIELLHTDKDFIAVSEEVSTLRFFVKAVKGGGCPTFLLTPHPFSNFPTLYRSLLSQMC